MVIKKKSYIHICHWRKLEGKEKKGMSRETVHTSYQIPVKLSAAQEEQAKPNDGPAKII